MTKYRGLSVEWVVCNTICTNPQIATPPDMIRQYLEHLIDTHTLEEFQQIYTIYYDYLHFLPDAMEMNNRRAANGEPTFKYEIFPKASHLQDLHDKAYRDHEVLSTERENKQRRLLNKQIKHVIHSPDYQQFVYQSDKYAVISVRNQQDLEREGEMLSHCVASYGSRLAEGKSYIYFIREASRINKPFFTAEIIPGDYYGRIKDRPRLTQCYTYNDTIDKPDSLKEFIREWADKCKFQITCRI